LDSAGESHPKTKDVENFPLSKPLKNEEEVPEECTNGRIRLEDHQD
jgi:hypothetical protein